MIPDSIEVQGCTWKIELVKELADDHGRQCHGLCEFETKTIKIRINDKKTMLATMIHETVHAICEQSGLHQTYTWSYDFEEILAEQISNFFMSGSAKITFPKGGDLKSKAVKKKRVRK